MAQIDPIPWVASASLQATIWTMQLTDSLLPFTFGVFEFAMIIELENGVAVLATVGLFLLLGVVALEYTYWQARKSESAAFTTQLSRGFRAVDIT